MTAYTDQRDAAGRAPFYLVEWTIDQCAHEFGVAPCTATGADGARCFHSWKTCQDRDNFSQSTQTWRFISSGVSPQQVPAIWATWPVIYPLLTGIDQVEQQVSLYGGFRRQEKFSFTLADINGGPNVDLVPNLSPGKSGNVNTTRAGSLWRRFLAIHPNYAGRPVKVYKGYVTESFATSDLKTIFEGKLRDVQIAKDGSIKVSGEDVFGDFEKKLPAKIGKGNTVQTTVGRSATLVTVRDGGEYTAPASQPGNFVTAQVKTVSGNVELVKITAITGNVLTVTRGQYGTAAEAWIGDDQVKPGKGTRVQEVLHYSTDDGLDGLLPTDVISDLWQRAGIPSASIDSTSLADAKTWIGPWKVKRTISKPTQVKKLSQEILELYQGAAFIDDDRKAKIWVSRPADPSETIGSLTDADILDHGLEYDRGESMRLTHASIAYGYDDGDEDETGAGVAIHINLDAFRSENYGVGEENRYERSLKGGRWVQSWDEYQAICACTRWDKRSRDGREKLVFRVDQRKESDLAVGKLVDVNCRYVQDAYGANRSLRCVVISRKRISLGRFQVALEDTGLGIEDGGQDSQRYAIIGPNTMVDYDSDTAANQAAYAYLADSNGTLGAAGDRAKLIP